MRTLDEIIERVKKEQQKQFMSFQPEVMIYYLDYAHAKEFLKEDITEDKWKPIPYTRENILKEMKEYMEFAWGKVLNHRGISAGRSVDKMKAWVWLLGDDEILKQMNSAWYAQYGSPKLAVVCNHYGFPVPQDEEVQRMIKGLPCTEDCRDGCGE